MDILPAIPNLEGRPESLLITDKNLTLWQHSDPKGYAAWFWSQMEVIFESERKALAKALGAEIEDVPDWKVKTPLQRSVQLLKRHRDIYFQNDPNGKPASIIISTLAAHAYAGHTDLFTALCHIAQTMPRYIQIRNEVYWVENPVNSKENFADKWEQDPQRKTNFFTWLRKLQTDLDRVSETRNLPGLSETLKKSFGPKIIDEVIKGYGDSIHRQRNEGNLFMAANSGILGSTGNTQVKRHTFYGELAEPQGD